MSKSFDIFLCILVFGKVATKRKMDWMTLASLNARSFKETIVPFYQSVRRFNIAFSIKVNAVPKLNLFLKKYCHLYWKQRHYDDVSFQLIKLQAQIIINIDLRFSISLATFRKMCAGNRFRWSATFHQSLALATACSAIFVVESVLSCYVLWSWIRSFTTTCLSPLWAWRQRDLPLHVYKRTSAQRSLGRRK